MSSIGARLPRKEDPRLLRGRGRFGDDISVPGQLWARVVRSPSAHGDLIDVDVTLAAKAPGITAVVTAADLPADLVIPVRLAVPGADLSGCLQPVLARTAVRYVGEPLAVVVGEDPYACEDAAELIEIDISERTVVLDARTAKGPPAAELTRGYGDVDAAFAAAPHVVRIELAIGRHSGVPLEPRCLLAVPDPDTGALDIFGMTKVPVFNRDLLARLLGLDETLIHVHGVDAGGGFGVRGEFYPEDFLVPWLARRLGCSVKWAEDRAEHLVAVNHSRQQHHRIAAAFDADGAILALADDVAHDNGAYCRTHGVAVPELTVAMLPGPYRVPAYRGRIRAVLTNKTPCGTYRAPGRFEGTAAREHLLDVAADQLGLDRIELRRRNLLTRDEIPHRRPIAALGTDLILDTGDYPALLAAAAREADRLGYHALVRHPDPHTRRGFGLALFVEKSGLGPQETADVTVSKSGAVHVYSGGTSVGQGIETVLAQIAADALGVDPGIVRVITGDTAAQPFGAGSWASRSTVVGGSAVHQAAAAVRERAVRLAARILEVAEEDLDVSDGTVVVRGDPGARVGLAEIARAAEPASRYLEPGEPALVRPPPLRGLAHDLPVRRARRGGGGRPGHGAGPGAALPGGLRGRPGRQPDAGRGPAAGRRGPGHRRGLVRGVRLRRDGPAPGDLVHRVPDADRGRSPAGRPPGLPGRPVAGQPAGRDGRGRGWRQRGRRRGGQRGPGRARPGRRRRPAAAHSSAGPRAMGGFL